MSSVIESQLMGYKEVIFLSKNKTLVYLQLLVKRAVDLAERAATSWALDYTDFLAPPLLADVRANTHKLADVGVVAWGGFKQAERCRLCIGNAELIASAEADLEQVACLLLPGQVL